MKVLILTITAGHGHNQTAGAIYNYLKTQGHNALTLDAYEYINPVLKDSINYGYLISTSISPRVYGKFYRLAEKREKADSPVSILKITNSILAKKIHAFLEDYRPDVIICTHVYAALLISYLKSHGYTIPTLGIITDFTMHPYWEETDIDYYVLANESLVHQAVKKGLPKEKLLSFGIPIHPKFSVSSSRQVARKALGIADKPTILVMSGSMGYGNIAKNIRSLLEMEGDFQIISVCGNNKNAKKKIDKLVKTKPLYNFGFVNNVDTLMDASDIIVSKPGGLTTSEALAKDLPMVIVSPIPGQEERNTEFLVNNGLARAVTSTYPVDEAVYQLLHDERKLDAIRQTIRLYQKPHATKDLAEFITKYLKA